MAIPLLYVHLIGCSRSLGIKMGSTTPNQARYILSLEKFRTPSSSWLGASSLNIPLYKPVAAQR